MKRTDCNIGLISKHFCSNIFSDELFYSSWCASFPDDPKESSLLWTLLRREIRNTFNSFFASVSIVAGRMTTREVATTNLSKSALYLVHCFANIARLLLLFTLARPLWIQKKRKRHRTMRTTISFTGQRRAFESCSNKGTHFWPLRQRNHLPSFRYLHQQQCV